MTTKTEKAKEIAKANPDMDYNELKSKIQEEVPCSRTLAHNAITAVRKTSAVSKEPQEPQVTIMEEKKKEPAFIEEPEVAAEEPEAKPIEEIQPEVQPPDFEVFRDMTRGLYIMVLSDKGMLGSKYGRNEDQCVQCADQMTRWLYRRYGEELWKYDTILLVLSHSALVGGIATTWVNERRKKQEKTTKKE